MVNNGHRLIPRASLVPRDDPTTLFTGSGMQPLIPYLLGEEHPAGSRLVDSQTCFRAEDMDEVGDNRHTTFFEMLGNWSLGDYFKTEQLSWFFEFLTEVVGLDPAKLYVTCFSGDEATGVPKDTESAAIWQRLFESKKIEARQVELGSSEEGYQKGLQGGRIFFYDASKNWWSRTGVPANMAEGEPGGPDSEVFYDFGIEHDPVYGPFCHPNCDCGRFLEIGNSVFMTYRKTSAGFEPLPKPNVDFGGGLERIAAAKADDRDVFKISLLWPVIEGLQRLSAQPYEQHTEAMRVIADHLRAAVWLAVDGVLPGNKEQAYVVRRLLRRAIRYGFDIGINQDLCQQVVPVVAGLYSDYPEVKKQQNTITEAFAKEERVFRQTLRAGMRELGKLARDGHQLTGSDVFKLYDTHGFPAELSLEEARRQQIAVAENWRQQYQKLLDEQKKRSRSFSAGTFKGGLADHSEAVVRLHTATHLMYQALKEVLGNGVLQRGSNITAERLRFDFSWPEKVTSEQLRNVEQIVNQKISEDLPVSWSEEKTADALKTASGAFGDKYGEVVKVYTIGLADAPFSREVCGGPHVEHTGLIGEGGKQFRIVKEEASSAGVRRIKAVLK